MVCVKRPDESFLTIHVGQTRAHRLATLKDCDRFYDGVIVETGTYEELVLHGGLFAELVYSAEQGVDAHAQSMRVSAYGSCLTFTGLAPPSSRNARAIAH
jgi:hypothetical protein